VGEQSDDACIGCERCVVVCPGLAITLVDYRQDANQPTVTVPYEFLECSVHVGDVVTAVDVKGATLAQVEIASIRASMASDHTVLVRVRVPGECAARVAGILVQADQGHVAVPTEAHVRGMGDEIIVCRCERVTVGDIRTLIQEGYRDINAIKALSRAGMGACGGKTCVPLIHRIFREEGISPDEIVDHVRRPLFMEVPLGRFAGLEEDDGQL
jgi:ferredoxin